MKNFLYLVLLFSGAYSSTMDQDALRKEIQHVLEQDYLFEDAALATFKPETSDHKQLFWIQAAKVGYHAVPVMAVFGPALYALVQGEAVGAVIISCVYPFAWFLWRSNRNAVMVSNEMVAKRLLPEQYDQHYKMCEGLHNQ